MNSIPYDGHNLYKIDFGGNDLYPYLYLNMYDKKLVKLIKQFA